MARTFSRIRSPPCARSDLPADQWELIVVDDGSGDGSADVAAQYADAVVRLDRAHGPAAARNRGVARARGEILVFIDADVSVHQSALSGLQRHLRARAGRRRRLRRVRYLAPRAGTGLAVPEPAASQGARGAPRRRRDVLDRMRRHAARGVRGRRRLRPDARSRSRTSSWATACGRSGIASCLRPGDPGHPPEAVDPGLDDQDRSVRPGRDLDATDPRAGAPAVPGRSTSGRWRSCTRC